MRTIILATAAVLSFGVGSAFAGDGDVPQADTYFTELPGVVAQAPVQQAAPSAIARNQAGQAPTAAFVTNHSTGTWLNNGSGSHEGANS